MNPHRIPRRGILARATALAAMAVGVLPSTTAAVAEAAGVTDGRVLDHVRRPLARRER